MRAVLSAQINKTDRNDARGIAQMMRAGLYRPVHVKTPVTYVSRLDNRLPGWAFRTRTLESVRELFAFPLRGWGYAASRSAQRTRRASSTAATETAAPPIVVVPLIWAEAR